VPAPAPSLVQPANKSPLITFIPRFHVPGAGAVRERASNIYMRA
jgi:hypothetical protein